MTATLKLDKDIKDALVIWIYEYRFGRFPTGLTISEIYAQLRMKE